MGVYLHRKHGLNPTMTTCFYCNKAKDILLVGAKVAKFREAGLADGDGRMQSNIGVINYEPCSECAGFMAQGIILISVLDGDEEKKNPYRTGGWCVVKDEAIKAIVNPPELADEICRRRVCFIPDEAWKKLGLPELPELPKSELGKTA